MALYVFRVDTGELVSWAPADDDQVASSEELASRGLAVVFGLPGLNDAHAWDQQQRTIVDVAPAPEVRMIGTGRWVLRLTADEFDAITASADRAVRHFMYALDRTTEINLNDPLITQGIDYLVSIGLLSAARRDEVLA